VNTPRGIKSARPVIALLFLAFVSGVCACGGGGGGGGGGSTGGTGVRVLHGSIDSVPVDVVSSSSSSVVVSQAMFGLADSYKSLRPGAQILSLTKAFNTSQVVDSFSVDYAAGARYSILLYGDHGAFGVRTALIPDEFPASFDGSLVRVVDGMTGASALTVTASGAAPFAVSFGEASDYVAVQSGSVTVQAVRSSDLRAAATAVVATQSGKAYTVLVAGELGYYTKAVVFADN
jgi:hypothetical protein